MKRFRKGQTIELRKKTGFDEKGFVGIIEFKNQFVFVLTEAGNKSEAF